MSSSPIPPFLDPLLDYLADALPSPLYALFEAALHHSIALLLSLYTVAVALVTSHPSTWEPEKILPPIITLFAAYFAVLSFYRTTTWMIRTVLSFLKWGLILTTIGAFLGFLLANGGDVGNGVELAGLLGGAGGIFAGAGGYILDAFVGHGDEELDSEGSTRSNINANWEYRQDGQYQQNRDDAPGGIQDAQKVIGSILGTTGRVIRNSGMWGAAMGVMNGMTEGDGSGQRRRRRGRAEETQPQITSVSDDSL